MNKGFLYENKIFDLMKNHQLLSTDFMNKSPAGCDNTQPDLILNINNQDVNLELKESIKSQAGGTSLRYKNNKFSLVKNIEGVSKEDLFDILLSKKDDFDNFLSYHNTDCFPFVTTKSLWTESVDKGLLKKTNIKVTSDSLFIENHYTSKNTFYIQIGKKGLYYMKEDIANLGVPKFKGNIQLEIRPARSGSKLNSKGERICSGILRIQARIKNIKESPFNLENILTINKLKEISNLRK